MKQFFVASAGVLALLAGAPAHAGDGEWETVASGKVTVKTRTTPGTAVNELFAETEMNAAPYDIQLALSNNKRVREYMPHVADNREISETLPDNSVYIYTLVDAPVVGKRDYVIRNWLIESAAPGGTGNFRTRWEAVPDYLPERHGIIRLKLNRGTWDVTPIGDGSRSKVRYTLLVDPGGWVPAFAANAANKRGTLETFAAVEGEAQRVAKQRKADEAKAAKQGSGGGALAQESPQDAAVPARQ